MIFLFVYAGIYYILIIQNFQILYTVPYALHLSYHLLFIVAVTDSVQHMPSG